MEMKQTQTTLEMEAGEFNSKGFSVGNQRALIGFMIDHKREKAGESKTCEQFCSPAYKGSFCALCEYASTKFNLKILLNDFTYGRQTQIAVA